MVTVSPYDRGWAWMIVLGAFISLFMSLGLIRSYGIIMAVVIARFQVSTAYAVVPITVVAVVFAFLGPILVMMSEAYSVRKVVMFGSIVGATGIAFSSLLFSMPYFIVMYGVSFGIGAASLAGTGTLLLTKYFIKYRSFATGLAMSGASVGQFVMPVLIEYLLETYGLPGTMLIMAGLFLHSAISAALYRPLKSYGPTTPEKKDHAPANEDDPKSEDAPFLDNLDVVSHPSKDNPRKDKKWERQQIDTEMNDGTKKAEDAKTQTIGHSVDGDDEKTKDGTAVTEVELDRLIVTSTSSAPRPEKTPPAFSLRQVFDFSVLKRLDSLLIVSEALLCFLGLMSIMIFLPGIITERGYFAYENASLLSVMGIGDLVGRIGSGILADLKLMRRYRMEAVAALLAGVASCAILFTDGFAALAALCGFFGACSGGYIALFPPVVLDMVGPERMAKNFAMGLFLQGVGSAAGQPFLGMLRDVTGSYDAVLIFSSACVTIGGVLLLCYPIIAKWDAELQEKALERCKTAE